MQQTDYLIAGASHAALAALHAIRLADVAGTVTLIGKDASLPYSPTVLPYVVSGRSDPAQVFLRDDAYFAAQHTDFRKGRHLVGLDPVARIAKLDDGQTLQFGKLLLATGARPVIPDVRGLAGVRYHVLRTLSDAEGLRGALSGIRHAIVLGAGLVGLHAAENLRHGGARVTVIELQPQILAGYFDATAAAMIASAFAKAGVEIRTGRRLTEVSAAAEGFTVGLDNGESLAGDLLLVGAGVEPVMDYLSDSSVARDRGILVNDTMQTSVSDIWAAGDVAQAPGFYDARPVLNGILPDAVEQGRIAGMAMAGDPALHAYRGAVPLNTYTYFGRQAVSVGSNVAPPGAKIVVNADAATDRYLKIILDEGRLHGIFAINTPLDAGVLWELVRRRIDLSAIADQFVAQPRDTARLLMSRLWR